MTPPDPYLSCTLCPRRCGADRRSGGAAEIANRIGETERIEVKITNKTQAALKEDHNGKRFYDTEFAPEKKLTDEPPNGTDPSTGGNLTHPVISSVPQKLLVAKPASGRQGFCAETGVKSGSSTVYTPYRNSNVVSPGGLVNPAPARRGFCGEGTELRIASASIHRGEEPPITGRGGSGTVFITGCTLGCGFCQNWQISRNGMGRAVSPGEFAELCLALQGHGAENINLVTGSHAIPALAEGLIAARNRGLSIPVLWNSSAYETPEALELLRDLVDVYLPDLKTLDRDISRTFFRAEDYPEEAVRAIGTMLAFRGGLRYGPGGVLRSGVVIRHLILPGHAAATREVIRWFADNARGKALLSLMTQYTPVPGGGNLPAERFLGQDEYDEVLRWLEEFGVEDGFLQEPVHGSDWLPDFGRENPFSSELSLPVWHWKTGLIPG